MDWHLLQQLISFCSAFCTALPVNNNQTEARKTVKSTVVEPGTFQISKDIF
jgi:hypothetical protein